mgnify:CR=1 FL=1
MSNSYYVYNNEAISALVIKKYIEICRIIDLSRLFIILPILLNDKLVQILSKERFEDIEGLIEKHPTLFSDFNDRYLELTPITINSFTLLREMNVIKFEKGNVFYEEDAKIDSNDFEVGDRLTKILFSMKSFIDLTCKYQTDSIYKILKIRL